MRMINVWIGGWRVELTLSAKAGGYWMPRIRGHDGFN
jgi:hypothetical protein